jgi:hypothetical protein
LDTHALTRSTIAADVAMPLASSRRMKRTGLGPARTASMIAASS